MVQTTKVRVCIELAKKMDGNMNLYYESINFTRKKKYSIEQNNY